MSRKHNTKHHRSPSRYKERLEARGLHRTPEMADYVGAKKKAKAAEVKA